jgi:hypothetical protein
MLSIWDKLCPSVFNQNLFVQFSFRVAGIEKKCNFAAEIGSVAQLDRATAF